MPVSEFDLAPTVKAHIVPGRLTAARPQLWLNSPAVVLRSDAADDAERTVGSRAWLWGDDEDWRFDAGSGVLTSAVLTVPEINVGTDLGLRDWDHSTTVTGTLRMEQPHDFGRPPTSVRWFDPAGTELLGFYSPDPATDRPRYRIAIADGTHLLIAGNTFAGWAITDPARYITGEAVAPEAYATEPDLRLPPLLSAFLSLVTEENIDKLEAGDTEIRSGLQQLATQLRAVSADGETRAAEVLSKVRQVLEDFAG